MVEAIQPVLTKVGEKEKIDIDMIRNTLDM